MLYEFTELCFEKDEFDNLVFMNAPPDWESRPEKHKFLLSICKVTLRKVVEKVIKESNYEGNNPTKVFENIDVIAESEDRPWFEPHVHISRSFDKVEWANSGLGICPVIVEVKGKNAPMDHSTWRMVITARSFMQCM